MLSGLVRINARLMHHHMTPDSAGACTTATPLTAPVPPADWPDAHLGLVRFIDSLSLARSLLLSV